MIPRTHKTFMIQDRDLKCPALFQSRKPGRQATPRQRSEHQGTAHPERPPGGPQDALRDDFHNRAIPNPQVHLPSLQGSQIAFPAPPPGRLPRTKTEPRGGKPWNRDPRSSADEPGNPGIAGYPAPNSSSSRPSAQSKQSAGLSAAVRTKRRGRPLQHREGAATKISHPRQKAAETFESHLRLISNHRQDTPHRAAHLIARLTRISVHAALFTVWAPATIARFALLTAITGQKPAPLSGDQQSPCPSL